jgi:hypothetical protein
MNQFAALSQDWNEDYNTGPYMEYAEPTWGWGGMYALSKVPEGTRNECEGDCKCAFTKVERERRK